MWQYRTRSNTAKIRINAKCFSLNKKSIQIITSKQDLNANAHFTLKFA